MISIQSILNRNRNCKNWCALVFRALALGVGYGLLMVVRLCSSNERWCFAFLCACVCVCDYGGFL